MIPEYRGLGVARLLAARALAEARAAGADRAFSQVLVRNEAAIELHERLGFVVAGAYRYAELDGATSDPGTRRAPAGRATGNL